MPTDHELRTLDDLALIEERLHRGVPERLEDTVFSS
jgi:hypothetical protein